VSVARFLQRLYRVPDLGLRNDFLMSHLERKRDAQRWEYIQEVMDTADFKRLGGPALVVLLTQAWQMAEYFPGISGTPVPPLRYREFFAKVKAWLLVNCDVREHCTFASRCSKETFRCLHGLEPSCLKA